MEPFISAPQDLGSARLAFTEDEPPRSTGDNGISLNTFLSYRESVLARRPAFKTILDRHGKKSLARYVQEYATFAHYPENTVRQQELIGTIKEEVQRTLGNDVAFSVAEQLKHYYYASTTDHFGPIHNPWVLNYNLVASSAYLDHPDPALKNVITLACSNVSLNNFSFPRGLSFTSVTKENKTAVHRLSFLPSNAHGQTVFDFRAYGKQDIDKVKSQLKLKVQSGEIRKREEQAMRRILDEIYLAPPVLSARNYADQVTMTNAALWKKILPAGRKKDLNFVYIEQERVVASALSRHHLGKGTALDRLIFDQSDTTLLTRFFNGVADCFDVASKTGTYLFWALPGTSGNRLQLWKQGNMLVSPCGKYRIPLTPEAISQALEQGELIPSVMLTFLTLCFYYGLTCLGGMGQVTYLPKMKEAYLSMQAELRDAESVAACKDVETMNLGGEVSIAFMDCINGDLVPATSLDLILYGEATTFTSISQHARDITLGESLDITLPTEYPMLYTVAERDPAFYAITAQDISRLLQRSGRLHPSVFMQTEPILGADDRSYPLPMPTVLRPLGAQMI